MKSSSLLAATSFVASAAAQASGWIPGQINASMCYWEQPRAAVVRDTLYLDGGSVVWIPGMNDSSYGPVTADQNPLGIVYTLNFSVPFAVKDNLTADMGVLYKVSPGSNANNIAPNYIDGAMLANDDEWFLYGGLLKYTTQYSQPPSDAAQLYQADRYGAEREFRPGFLNVDLPANMTRYVAYGGAASAPSENKAWYFSGLRSPSWGPVYTVTGVDGLTAINVSDTLITVDMATQNAETWSNSTLPPTVRGRANPELVWVPVGPQGVLVAIGGVVDPQWVAVTGQSYNASASRAASPAFLTTLDVYDVAGKKWYKQPTTGGARLGQRTRACAVVAAAADASSFNIYYYGGFDGLSVGSDFNDDVWVLSLPSFTWTQVYASSDAAAHARAGHKCVAPYPDQMLVVGGYTPQAGAAAGCLGGGIVQLFNLSSATWMTSYTPTKWSAYSVPDAVVSVIGGSGKGGATATAPAAAGGWADAGLKAVFATAYPTAKLTTYYPYPLNASATTAPNNTHPDAPGPSSGGHHTPAFVAPLVGVIGGLIVLTAAVVGVLLYRRRRILMYGSSAGRRSSRGTGPVGGSGQPGTESEATYDTGRNFVFSWLRAQPSVKHAASTPAASSYDDPHSSAANRGRVQSYGGQYSSSTPLSPEMEQLQAAHLAAQHSGSGAGYATLAAGAVGGAAAAGAGAGAPTVEADNTYISELIADTKYRAELPGSSDFGSVTTDANSSSRMLRGGATYHSVPTSSAELESPLVPGSQAAQHGSTSSLGPAPQQQPPVFARADSPSLGQAPRFPPQQPPQAPLQQPAQEPAQQTPRPAPAPAAPRSVARESGVSDLSEQDRRHLRQGSEGGQSTTSGVSSAVGTTSGYQRNSLNLSGAVSPLGAQFPPAVTGVVGGATIPEADAGAEAAAEAAARPSAPPPLQTDQQPPTQPQPRESPSQTSLQGSGGDSPGQSRRSAFRESEADLRE
ncbi:hypothetical protein HMPREF1624_07361 [Sporothrix schenckii ATCC 58251]|uniref:Kelch repeat protein n=1 Tax=Sporothrix schenckii (strain ATCC 58251 / de Perez 2211183) TaxID=1391915 RepID=U7PPP6_SPOS1|nr:hypothetical protein HMPREF1624_07361 [Sporothrix schenckii ATCC 58251]